MAFDLSSKIPKDHDIVCLEWFPKDMSFGSQVGQISGNQPRWWGTSHTAIERATGDGRRPAHRDAEPPARRSQGPKSVAGVVGWEPLVLAKRLCDKRRH